MNLKNSSIAVFVRDIEISKKFYQNTLGLEIEFDFGTNVIFKGGIAVWEINPNHIIPKKFGNAISNPSINRFELYFETENLDEVYQALHSSNVKFLHEIQEERWGQRNIRFFDPDNHLIEIGESLRCFVTRFLDSGMSREQVATRTGINLGDFDRILSWNVHRRWQVLTNSVRSFYFSKTCQNMKHLTTSSFHENLIHTLTLQLDSLMPFASYATLPW